MMIFLVDYDRQRGQLVDLRVFPVERREEAENARLELELALNRSDVVREVVLLEAPSERALRLTHRRYFEEAAGLMDAPATTQQ
jgi:hypothetical protein